MRRLAPILLAVTIVLGHPLCCCFVHAAHAAQDPPQAHASGHDHDDTTGATSGAASGATSGGGGHGDDGCQCRQSDLTLPVAPATPSAVVLSPNPMPLALPLAQPVFLASTLSVWTHPRAGPSSPPPGLFAQHCLLLI